MALLREVHMTPHNYAQRTGRSSSTLYRWINMKGKEPRVPTGFFREVSEVTGFAPEVVEQRLSGGGQKGEREMLRDPQKPYLVAGVTASDLHNRTNDLVARLVDLERTLGELARDAAAIAAEVSRLRKRGNTS